MMSRGGVNLHGGASMMIVLKQMKCQTQKFRNT